MYTVRGTKKFLDRVGRPTLDPPDASTLLGNWYANVLFWKPRVALFVNEATFLPVIVPFAPAATVTTRFPAALADVLLALGTGPQFVATELDEMRTVAVASTASRRVLGVMNEFALIAERAVGLGRHHPSNLVELSAWLATIIVGPLAKAGIYTPLDALQQRITTNHSHRPLS